MKGEPGRGGGGCGLGRRGGGRGEPGAAGPGRGPGRVRGTRSRRGTAGTDPAERVEAELEILGIDLTRHVVSFYEDLLGQLGVVRSADLRRCRSGDRILVAGVKVATQTPAIRSGMRIIFVTLDDATGPVDLAFFESVQPRCAARVFGSWLLVVRGRVRRTGRSVSVNGEECWDLAALEEIRAASGIGAVRAAMAAGDVPAQGARARQGDRAGRRTPRRRARRSSTPTASCCPRTPRPGPPARG